MLAVDTLLNGRGTSATRNKARTGAARFDQVGFGARIR
jgi:hypothetical protein